MFERFTERGRRVIVLSQEEARRLSHGYIGTEHLLLGLLREGDGLAARVLGSFAVTLDSTREHVARVIGPGDEPVRSGEMPLTPRSRKVLELGVREAQELGHAAVDTEHVLLGLVREGSGVAARILTADYGLDGNAIRDRVLEALDQPPP